MSKSNPAEKFSQRVGYNEEEQNLFFEGVHRERHIRRIYKVYRLFSIEAQVVKARHCNSGYKTGDTFVLDVGGDRFVRPGTLLPGQSIPLHRPYADTRKTRATK